MNIDDIIIASACGVVGNGKKEDPIRFKAQLRSTDYTVRNSEAAYLGSRTHNSLVPCELKNILVGPHAKGYKRCVYAKEEK